VNQEKPKKNIANDSNQNTGLHPFRKDVTEPGRMEKMPINNIQVNIP